MKKTLFSTLLFILYTKTADSLVIGDYQQYKRNSIKGLIEITHVDNIDELSVEAIASDKYLQMQLERSGDTINRHVFLQ